MKFKNLDIKNFLTIGEATLNLEDRGLLLIQGENLDDSSAMSNGAGKSSIVDALCWVIYGTTARGTSSDAVVNKLFKKDCRVSVELSDSGNFYRIDRYRKDSTHKNQTFVWKLNASPAFEMDLSKGTDKETQEVINKLMGCSIDVFMAAVYAGQERMPDLPGMTDKMLKVLIEEAAGVEILTEAYSVARSRFNISKAALDAQNSLRSTALSRQVELDMELTNQELLSQQFEDDRRARAKAELIKVPPVLAEISTLNEKILKLDEAAVIRELDALQAQMMSFNADRLHCDALEKVASDYEQSANRLKTVCEISMRRLKTAEALLLDIDNQIGKPCGECGKVYCEHDLEAAKKLRVEDIAENKRTLKIEGLSLRTAQKAAEEAKTIAAACKATLPDVSTVASKQRALNMIISGIVGMRSDIEIMNGDIEKSKALAVTKMKEANPWAKAIEGKRIEVDSTINTLAHIQRAIDVYEKDAKRYENAVDVFGPAGVRAHILDTVTPFLNDRTSEYLGSLADGNIHATWATLTKNAKGELREKFNIDVVNDKGAETFAGLSGGEKRKVRLATAMALQDMVAGRAAKPISIFIADEVDHALDENGLERLMGLMEKKARDRGTVLVISHNSLGDWIDNVITVTKSKGYATVTGAING